MWPNEVTWGKVWVVEALGKGCQDCILGANNLFLMMIFHHGQNVNISNFKSELRWQMIWKWNMGGRVFPQRTTSNLLQKEQTSIRG